MKKKALFVMACIAVLFLYSCHSEDFKGSQIRNPDAYVLDIEQMNGVDTHVLKPEEGDVLSVVFETYEGTLKLEIRDPDHAVIYEGDGTLINDFTIEVLKSGMYEIRVEGHHAKGIIDMHTEEGK